MPTATTLRTRLETLISELVGIDARNPWLIPGAPGEAEIAGWLEMQQADFERAFLGRGRNGRAKRRVTVANASRLMIALGRAPNELEGC